MLGMKNCRMAPMGTYDGGRLHAGEAKFGVRWLDTALSPPGLTGRVTRRGQPRPMKARASSRTPHGAKKRPARQHRGGLTATVPKSKIKSTCSKQTTSENSNRNKNALFSTAAKIERKQPAALQTAGGRTGCRRYDDRNQLGVSGRSRSESDPERSLRQHLDGHLHHGALAV